MNAQATAPLPITNFRSYRNQTGLIILLFVVSRTIIALFGIHFKYEALFKYWQYLDMETLRHHLLQGLWYDHAQPPVFNILLGCIVKIAGSNAPVVFSILLKIISLVNTLLLYTILIRLTRHPWIPLLLSLIYLLSPALLIFESELFYTTFISLLLLTSAFFLSQLSGKVNEPHPQKTSGITIAGIFAPLAVACLTRSMYHILWLAVIGAAVLFSFRKTAAFKGLFAGLALSLLLVGGWYVKNYVVFGQFSASSWLGMNMARTVFHDHPMKDSSRIEAFEPFSDINTYRKFIAGDAEKRYAGLDDRDLLQVYKNDSLKNENHIAYIEISRRYMEVSKQYIKSHPLNYGKNVLQSAVMFFAPATRYPYAEKEAGKIKYYDLFYSFNLTHFANAHNQTRIALTISAIPKMLLYLAVLFFILRQAIHRKYLSPLNVFILLPISFSFFISSFTEN